MRMHRAGYLSLVGLAAALLAMSADARGDAITFDTTTDLLGQGLGNKATMLVVQTPNGRTSNEWGSVLWNGTEDVKTGEDILAAQSQTWTRSALESRLGSLTADSFGVLFDLSEPGNDKSLDLTGFTLRFYSGANAVFDAVYTGNGADQPTHFVQIGAGTGSAGYLFRVNFAAGHFGSWDRVGMFVSPGAITYADGDHEDFSIVKAPIAVPLPGAAQASGLLLAGLISWRALRRRA